jgi:dihydrofolate synthase/folylpolyglutamate synthase
LDYREAIAYLDRHVNLEARAGRIEGLSLDPVRRLLDVLGDPQHSYRVVHITGTNGKGSVARMITALLVEHGLSVGTYTSPHLERVNERLAWNGTAIDDDQFAQVISEVAELAPLAGVEPSYFELLTAAAFSWFAQCPVDVAVIEVGLLGRFDATNVADADVAVITNIGRDHTDRVGDWRAAIAQEKAGIIKPDSFLVLGEADPRLRPVFDAEPHVGTWVRGVEFDVEQDLTAVGGHMLSLRTPGELYDEVLLPLHGQHQADNAALALAATETFFARPLDEQIVRDAFEVVGHFPLIILDGAHNPDGALATAQTLADEFEMAGRRIMVVGLLGGRDPREMLEAFELAQADLVLCCTPDSPRAVPAAELAVVAGEMGLDAEVVADPAEAIDRARAMAEEEDLILVTGSLYLVGAARSHLRPGHHGGPDAPLP